MVVVASRSRFSIAAVVAVAPALACNSPSKATIAAYHDAQRTALARVDAQEKRLAASVEEIRAGRWVPRADLGPCSVTMPTPPKAGERGGGNYPGWVVDNAYAEAINGWHQLPGRVMDRVRESIGDPASSNVPETEKDCVAKTARLAAFEPKGEPDLLLLYVDELHRPVQTSDKTFEGGDERGRAWVWSASKQTIVCATTFSSQTPPEVMVTFFSGDEDRKGRTDSDLMLSLRQDSIRVSVASLIAAGPPK